VSPAAHTIMILRNGSSPDGRDRQDSGRSLAIHFDVEGDVLSCAAIAKSLHQLHV